jgi:pantoate--beta-alanine ligase
MKRCTTVSTLRDELRRARQAGKRIGFVPTMGALHEGHLSLARTLTRHCDVRVCSVFVNPTQFNDPKDYEAYVINIENDQALLEREGVDLLFAPAVEEVYPPGFQTSVMVRDVSKPFEGALRPGHFEGVATVVTVLFNIVRPDVAIFGEKDFQQLVLIERMVEDLKLDIEIVRGALVRDPDGLALSSRNVRLSSEGRGHALKISRGLFKARAAFEAGERRSVVLEDLVVQEISAMPNPQIDYVALVDERSLQRVEGVEGPCRMLVVARVDGVRLLDNIGFAGVAGVCR